jgi:hypothetical protein
MIGEYSARAGSGLVNTGLGYLEGLELACADADGSEDAGDPLDDGPAEVDTPFWKSLVAGVHQSFVPSEI